jgi:hypothetical protein
MRRQDMHDNTSDHQQDQDKEPIDLITNIEMCNCFLLVISSTIDVVISINTPQGHVGVLDLVEAYEVRSKVVEQRHKL